jgi:hypothetical protein
MQVSDNPHQLSKDEVWAGGGLPELKDAQEAIAGPCRGF